MVLEMLKFYQRRFASLFQLQGYRSSRCSQLVSLAFLLFPLCVFSYYAAPLSRMIQQHSKLIFHPSCCDTVVQNKFNFFSQFLIFRLLPPLPSLDLDYSSHPVVRAQTCRGTGQHSASATVLKLLMHCNIHPRIIF